MSRQLFDRVRKVLLPKDYVRLRLTGEACLGYVGCLRHLLARRRPARLVRCAPRRDRPRAFAYASPEGGHRADRPIARGAQGALGHGRCSPVVAGGAGDNAASACGIGAVDARDRLPVARDVGRPLRIEFAAFSPNTAGAVHAFCHALPGRWHQMGVILSATDSLNWLSRLFGDSAVAILRERSARRSSAPRRCCSYPICRASGPRTTMPARAVVFVGLDQSSDRAAMTQAVLEGVAFAFRDCLRVLNDAGTDMSRAFAVGGGAKSDVWLTILASVLDRPLDLSAEADVGAAFGAARLAMAAHAGRRSGRPDAAAARRADDGTGPERSSAPMRSATSATARLYPAGPGGRLKRGRNRT